ncbi:MAG: hypothetical protein LC100_15125 [Chitinophagales bacterium]|nr:hypothetical protein [Chitinophagales bacterium]
MKCLILVSWITQVLIMTLLGMSGLLEWNASCGEMIYRMQKEIHIASMKLPNLLKNCDVKFYVTPHVT